MRTLRSHTRYEIFINCWVLQRLLGGRLMHKRCWGLAVTQKNYNRGSFHITSSKWASYSVFSFEFRFFRPAFCIIMDFSRI